MPKKIVKKRKIKLLNFLIFLLVLSVLSFSVYFILQIKVKNLIVTGTNYIEDDTILEIAKVKDYPKFLLTTNYSVRKKLLAYPYIKNAKILKKWPFTFEIKIEEARPLFNNTNNNSYVLDNNKNIKLSKSVYNFRVPRLLNYVPDKKYKSFVENMNKVNDNVLSKISDIEYQPNDYDKDRFLLYMDDGNMVYLTLTKFKMINHYNEVLKQLENHKGILYLDNGNHFKIME
ncbi:MAG: FtsQ-type POTRA domain-containing protein [Bacilli bacterium]|nr:FtsQ-type POTRA domain-containing protein [Bacilli bacterium]